MANSTEEDVPFVFDIKKMLQKTGALDNQENYINTVLEHKKPCSSQTQDSSVRFTKRLTLDFEFDTDIKSSAITESSELLHSYFEDKVVFKHMYQIINDGDSPSNEKTPFFLYIPDVVRPPKIMYDDERVVCNLNSQRTADLTPDAKTKVPLEISCESDKCRYDCNVMPGLVKDFPVEITVVMTLNPEQNAFELFKRENFEIVTKLKIDDEVITSKSKFEKNEVGKLEAILEWWPIILGGAIAAAVCGACIYGIVKSGLFERARIFHDVDDVEVTQKLNDDTNAGDHDP